MKLAIMQPYLFPYIGYFQLINAVDKFISYDDVNFIKQGWINRNRILSSGKIIYITVPLKGVSSFLPINTIHTNNIAWQPKLLKTIRQAYNKATYFNEIFPIIESVINDRQHLISKLAINSVLAVCDYLDIKSPILESSLTQTASNHLRAEERIITICLQEGCKQYINASGGINLYSKQHFDEKNIELQFIQPSNIFYKQFSDDYHPHLSIIDVLMHNSKNTIQQFLSEYKLV